MTQANQSNQKFVVNETIIGLAFARKIFLIVAALAALTCAPVRAAQGATPADKGSPRSR